MKNPPKLGDPEFLGFLLAPPNDSAAKLAVEGCGVGLAGNEPAAVALLATLHDRASKGDLASEMVAGWITDSAGRIIAARRVAVVPPHVAMPHVAVAPHPAAPPAKAQRDYLASLAPTSSTVAPPPGGFPKIPTTPATVPLDSTTPLTLNPAMWGPGTHTMNAPTALNLPTAQAQQAQQQAQAAQPVPPAPSTSFPSQPAQQPYQQAAAPAAATAPVDTSAPFDPSSMMAMMASMMAAQPGQPAPAVDPSQIAAQVMQGIAANNQVANEAANAVADQAQQGNVTAQQVMDMIAQTMAATPENPAAPPDDDAAGNWGLDFAGQVRKAMHRRTSFGPTAAGERRIDELNPATNPDAFADMLASRQLAEVPTLLPLVSPRVFPLLTPPSQAGHRLITRLLDLSRQGNAVADAWLNALAAAEQQVFAGARALAQVNAEVYPEVYADAMLSKTPPEVQPLLQDVLTNVMPLIKGNNPAGYRIVARLKAAAAAGNPVAPLWLAALQDAYQQAAAGHGQGTKVSIPPITPGVALNAAQLATPIGQKSLAEWLDAVHIRKNATHYHGKLSGLLNTRLPQTVAMQAASGADVATLLQATIEHSWPMHLVINIPIADLQQLCQDQLGQACDDETIEQLAVAKLQQAFANVLMGAGWVHPYNPHKVAAGAAFDLWNEILKPTVTGALSLALGPTVATAAVNMGESLVKGIRDEVTGKPTPAAQKVQVIKAAAANGDPGAVQAKAALVTVVDAQKTAQDLQAKLDAKAAQAATQAPGAPADTRYVPPPTWATMPQGDIGPDNPAYIDPNKAIAPQANTSFADIKSAAGADGDPDPFMPQPYIYHPYEMPDPTNFSGKAQKVPLLRSGKHGSFGTLRI
jgi:hypothetical protein